MLLLSPKMLAAAEETSALQNTERLPADHSVGHRNLIRDFTEILSKTFLQSGRIRGPSYCLSS